MATIIPHTTRATGTLLTAAIYNFDHQNHVTNANSLNSELSSVVDVGVSTGIIVSNGAGVISGRSIDVANGIQIVNADGLAGNPALSLGTLTGLTGINNFSTGAVLLGNDGTAGAPFYSFQSEAGLGIFRSGAGVLNFGVGGASRLALAAASLTLAAGVALVGEVGSFSGVLSALSTIELGHASDTTLARDSAGVIAVEGRPLHPAIPVNEQNSGDYTLVLADAQKAIYHPPSDTTPRTWTIPANASVAFPIGTIVTFDNDIGAGTITIAITSDTLVLVGAGTTGSRTLAPGGRAVAHKVAATRWRISGGNELT